MTTKYRNKYRIESARLKNWDYAWNAPYFVTICTKDRECYFGEMVKEEINLSEIGVIADKYWKTIPKHFPFVLLDEYVIMPNHMHGIIIINKPDHSNKRNENYDTNVETLHATSLHRSIPDPDGNEKIAKISPKPGSLSTIIRSYKSNVTKHARQINSDFAWQSRFFDHVIRDNESFTKIRYYIWDNPIKWSTDELNPVFEEIQN